jgi:hypothetical protein
MRRGRARAEDGGKVHHAGGGWRRGTTELDGLSKRAVTARTKHIRAMPGPTGQPVGWHGTPV